MKLLKVLALAAVVAAMPAAAYPQKKATPKTAVQAEDKYPLFEKDLAASLWQRWIRHDTFSQEDYGQALDLCMAAYDYLNSEMNYIINVYPAGPRRRNAALNTLDTGKASDMTTFARTMSNRLQNEAAAGKFNNENLIKINKVIQSKAEYKQLQSQINH